jgi:hypothetical protein
MITRIDNYVVKLNLEPTPQCITYHVAKKRSWYTKLHHTLAGREERWAVRIEPKGIS